LCAHRPETLYYDETVSRHRRSESLHRTGRRRRRTIAERGARLGLLLTALVTTGAVGAFALQPGDGTAGTRTVADDVESPTAEWLGLDAVREGIRDARTAASGADEDEAKTEDASVFTRLPPRSGHGRRVVFDLSRQRVWMVSANEKVRSSYLVSGSRLDNLQPGRYKVFSRSRHAVGYGNHSTMRYFVRFARGENSNIGFHDIPLDHSGKPVQSLKDLGTPQSAGCIRQRPVDAKRMWRFAQEGTKVVVVG